MGIAGNSGDDQLYGGAGNDRLVGGDGNNLLYGGDGIDVAVFAGTLADYRVALTADGQLQIKRAATGETDTLVEVELLQIGSRYYGLAADNPGLEAGQEAALAPFMVELTGQHVAAMGVTLL